MYEEILCYELTKLGYKVLRQLLLPIDYEKLRIKNAYKVDLLIEDKLVVELKSIHPLPLVCVNQLQTQFSLIGLKNGMLVDFKVTKMKDGIHRVFNNKGTEALSNPL